MQSSKEQQGETRKPSSVINAKEIEENNRMGKTRALFKKIRNTKGMIHAKMGSIKERNGKKAKWLSEEALQIAVKRREVKSKGEKER